ncbi:MAG: MotA/TolQ/ExbB proton channel family protein [Candidatus Sumerlaeia bacterium]
MKNLKLILLLIALLHSSLSIQAQDSDRKFDETAGSIQQKLEASIAELNALREKASEVNIPLSRKLNDLESELSKVRQEYQDTTRMLDNRTLDLSNLRNEIKSRKQEASYLSNLLSEFIRNFETRLHIAELQRYETQLEEAKNAVGNNNLSEEEVFKAQANILQLSIDRIRESLGGLTFTGSAVDPNGKVKSGTFVMMGPAALFQTKDGESIGTAEQRLGSLEPTIVSFANPEDAAAARKLMADASGPFPLDPTLGNAHKIEETQETLLEHIKKGGVVMYPIFTLAGLALTIALYKWLAMLFVRKPSRRKLQKLLTAVEKHDRKEAKQVANSMGGPIGKMLSAGVEHIKEPRELIEEVMFEKVLITRLKLQRFLPFISICAASAPLLGLLGTVTGIINTFKLITLFGSGDVKTLSGGISEALITTEFGLIVAIPSLLVHSFLSRKAQSIINEMEKAAIRFLNQVGRNPFKDTFMQDSSPAEVEEKEMAETRKDREGKKVTESVPDTVQVGSKAAHKFEYQQAEPDTM